MGATENAARIRKGYEAYNRGDVPVLVDLFADDIVWHFPGTSKLAGDHVGRDAVLAAVGQYAEAGAGTLNANVIDIMASDDHVTGIARDTASNANATLDIRSTVIFRMRDGQVAEAWHYVDAPDALDAFLA